MPGRIETDRLILETWTPKDAPALYAYAKNPNVGPNAGWKPHADVRESKRIIKTIFSAKDTWKIVWKENGEVIGSIGLDDDRRRPGIPSRELGYSLAEPYWGRGIMTEAGKAVLRYGFENLHLAIISIQTAVSNARSQSVIRKLGFHPEGMERMCYRIYDGTTVDEYVFSMLRSEWESLYLDPDADTEPASNTVAD